jgi:DNA end-binding protein Ku
VVIQPIDDGLAMHQLHFKAEVRELKELGLEPAKVSDAELKLAQQLIDQLGAERFDPNEYVDEFKERVEAAIQKKIEGKEISLSDVPVNNSKGNVIDLMDALRASIDARTSKSPHAERTQASQACWRSRYFAQDCSTMRCRSTTRKRSSVALGSIRPQSAH